MYIQKENEDMGRDSNASVLHSFASYYSLYEAYSGLFKRIGTTSPARLILLTAFVYWNYLNGGVDNFSRAVTTLCYTNNSENTTVSLPERMLCAHVSNAAVVFTHRARKRFGKLPVTVSDSKGQKRYRKLAVPWCVKLVHIFQVCTSSGKGVCESYQE